MKRSEINKAFCDASAFFARNHWTLPPRAAWDITDFGLGDFRQFGLTLINLAAEPEYCEKLMYAQRGQKTPCHTHHRKKEDIICRNGALAIQLWSELPSQLFDREKDFAVKVDGSLRRCLQGETLQLNAGSRVTLPPGIWHEFYSISDECIIGEVSTANDDVNDNIFTNAKIGRFPQTLEDEPSLIRLVSEV